MFSFALVASLICNLYSTFFHKDLGKLCYFFLICVFPVVINEGKNWNRSPYFDLIM